MAEVVGGLGVDKMHKLMPEIISTAERLDIAPHVKDGYIMLFIYFPGVFQQEFMQYIGEVQYIYIFNTVGTLENYVHIFRIIKNPMDTKYKTCKNRLNS